MTWRKQLGKQRSLDPPLEMLSRLSYSIQNQWRLRVKGQRKIFSMSWMVSLITILSPSLLIQFWNSILQFQTVKKRKYARQLFLKMQMLRRYSQYVFEQDCTVMYQNMELSISTSRQQLVRRLQSKLQRGMMKERAVSEVVLNDSMREQFGMKILIVFWRQGKKELSQNRALRQRAMRSMMVLVRQPGLLFDKMAVIRTEMICPQTLTFVLFSVSVRLMIFSSDLVSEMMQNYPLSMSLIMFVQYTKVYVSDVPIQ